ncbi:cytochrome-c peroxidase [Alphaproteobacteria bacterium GH1-50]|uniref:Cytochrome-c peroxidase n=1 Tax=Kangsaoukella pontilimi TaxID=2691042 RepID=A0A7C9IF62_9RHOB|nr:cytochrome-c peroxidase [Kangsaoukella pontilimi]
MTTIIATLLATAGARADTGPVALDPGDFEVFDPVQVRAGWLLFYDPILSGNRNISCATCHHPRFGTSDGLSLGLGEGGAGLGPERKADPANLPEQRIPRNSPALFNLGHRDIAVMFHDGRIERDENRESGLRTPLEDEMVTGFASLLSAQTMFPVLSADEMAGHYQENDVSKAVRQGRITGEGGAWDIISHRVEAIPDYAEMFRTFDTEIAAGKPLDFTDISDAIAAFVATEWRASDTAYDIALRGGAPLDPMAAEGQALFFGEAGCAACHSGPLLSDQSFHAMAEPQLGPGKAARFESHQRDDGRFRVTGREADAYAFRTPMLRNVVHTGPWGHAGAHTDLGRFLAYHADPARGLNGYAPHATLTDLPETKPDWTIMEDTAARDAIAASYAGEPVDLSDADIRRLIAFLAALTDETALKGRMGIPDTVPSGLPVDR